MHVVLLGDVGKYVRFRPGAGQGRIERMSGNLPLEGHFGQNNQVDVCCTGSAALGVKGHIVGDLLNIVLLSAGSGAVTTAIRVG